MLMDVQAQDAVALSRSVDRVAAGQGSLEPTRSFDTGRPSSFADKDTSAPVVLRRGPKLMVLYRGCPSPTAVNSLSHAGVSFGLALAPGELPAVRGLDKYAYVFVSTPRSLRATVAEAVADLELNGWSVEDDQV